MSLRLLRHIGVAPELVTVVTSTIYNNPINKVSAAIRPLLAAAAQACAVAGPQPGFAPVEFPVWSGFAQPPCDVRAFEPPHTGTNYLMREFIHIVGRKHSSKLRLISLLFMVMLPVMLLASPFLTHWVALIAVVSHIAGVLVSRWLFFAEAEHVVGLYYGKR